MFYFQEVLKYTSFICVCQPIVTYNKKQYVFIIKILLQERNLITDIYHKFFGNIHVHFAQQTSYFKAVQKGMKLHINLIACADIRNIQKLVIKNHIASQEVTLLIVPRK
jgi:hypothetical protein